MRLIHHLFAGCRLCIRSRLSPGHREFPTPATLNEHLPGLSPVLLPAELAPFPHRQDFHLLCAITASACRCKPEVFPCRPPSGKGVLDRIAGLLALGKRLTYKCQPPLVGLLGKASIEHGQAILMASGSTSRHLGGWLIPPPFVWLVARLLRLMPSIRKTSIERFYVTDNRDRKIDRGDSIPLLRQINQRFGNDVRVPTES